MCSAASPGPSTTADASVLIFDLDGTLLSVNSFPVWVLYLLRGPFGLGFIDRARVTGRTIVAMLRRKILRHDHATTKRRLQRIWAGAIAQEHPAMAEARLAAALMAKLRPTLSSVVKRAAADGQPMLLATAAVADYAAMLSVRLGFTHLICTPPHDAADWQETSGLVKRDRVLACLAAQGWETHRRIVFTDHADDLPLIRTAAFVLWFGSDKDLAVIRRLAPDIAIAQYRDIPADEIYRLVCPSSSGPITLRGEP